MASDTWLLHTDGACKGNPGPSGIGIALYKPGATEPAFTVAEKIPNTTNNVAEYTALIRGLKEALLRGVDKVEVRTDSELMAHQINGRYKVNAPQILPLYSEARVLLAKFASAKVTHVLRGQNALADKLANQGVAQKLAAPPKPAAAKPATTATQPVPAKPAPTPKPVPVPDVPYQKHSRMVGSERWVWNTERLWEAAKGLPAETIPVESLAEWLDKDCWFHENSQPTIRKVADHAKRIAEADLSLPIILDPEGGLMDGGHRLARAYLEGRAEIAAVRLPTLPEPDLRLS